MQALNQSMRSRMKPMSPPSSLGCEKSTWPPCVTSIRSAMCSPASSQVSRSSANCIVSAADTIPPMSVSHIPGLLGFTSERCCTHMSPCEFTPIKCTAVLAMPSTRTVPRSVVPMRSPDSLLTASCSLRQGPQAPISRNAAASAFIAAVESCASLRKCQIAPSSPKEYGGTSRPCDAMRSITTDSTLPTACPFTTNGRRTANAGRCALARAASTQEAAGP